MPEEDPTEELEEIIELYQNKQIPQEAFDWANGALETTEGILETIESMDANGHDVPTPAQEEALENIYVAACNWLKK
ncbi:MAG: hypothetical protein K8F52_16715 [Candidatus Scalindua rubra]|uniref:Uncharacterized protein n=1 Tax=Candidatus Scalindua brodae TaxID=237368 RepID=A0A0B0EL29_9BACT|nr:MAG: hypothetical protein SCABRO_00939 [Candidatus Scalindua brodae]MBZ0110293.1 hypothetical protein [Candidatus Scalindua rubra]